MAMTETQKRASRKRALKKYQDKKKAGKVTTLHHIPIRQHSALKELAEKTGKTIESITIELLTMGLKRKGYKF